MDQYRRGELTFDVIDAGPDDAPVVVLLHGFPQFNTSWHAVIDRTARGYRCLAPNQRGYSPGVRPEQPDDYRIHTLVDDVAAIADALGWPAFDLVGHDWGGAVAWWTADAHPDRLRTLTVVSTPHPGALATALRTDPDQRERSQYMITWRETPATEQRMLADDARALRAFYGEIVPPRSADAYVRHLSRPGALTAALNWYRAMPLLPPGALSGPVEVPTLYVWGRHDRFLGERAALLTGSCVAGPYRLEILADAGHWLPEEHPGTVAGLILDHIGAGEG